MYARDFALIATPIGMVRLIGTSETIEAVTIEREAISVTTAPRAALLAEGVDQIRAYFAGTLTHFDLPLAAPASPRGLAMRTAIMAISFGETRSYGAMARWRALSARQRARSGRRARAIHCRSSCRATG